MNTAVIRREWVGRTVDGRFPLLEYLGDSGTSIVFRTELDDTSKRAAVRLIPADSEDPQSLLKDWASAANLSHPHLMRIFASGQGEVDETRVSYVVTEYAEERLSEVIPERPLTPDEAREMLQPILGALEYLHSKGIVFGHLKPSDILVVQDQLKLPVDNIHSAAGHPTSDRDLSIYDAPETATGQVSPASDVWSLGVTLVEALTQHPPQWDRSSPSDPVVPESIPQLFAEIARRCLCLAPKNRITLDGIKRRVDGLPETTPEEIAAPVTPILEPPVPASAARIDTSSQIAPRRAAAGVRGRLYGVIAAAIVILIAFVLVRSRHSPAPAPANPPLATQSPAPSTPAAVPQPSPSLPSPTSGASARGEVAERMTPDVTAAASHTIRGKVLVTIRVSVDATGSVSGASIQSAGGSRYFAGKALDAAKKWRFQPAQVNGQPAPSVWTVEFVFRQDGISNTAKQVSP